MTDQNANQIDRAAEIAHRWVNEVSEEIGCDRAQGYHALRAGLHALRDRIPWEEGLHAAQQMPTLIRGLWFENWSPAEPHKARHVDEYLNIVKAKLAIDTVDPEDAARATFKVLKTHLDYRSDDPETGGQVAQVRHLLNDELKEFMDAA